MFSANISEKNKMMDTYTAHEYLTKLILEPHTYHLSMTDWHYFTA